MNKSTIKHILSIDFIIKSLVIIVVGLLIYSNAIHGEFISDDYIVVVDNMSIRSFNLQEIWEAFNTRFIVGLSFAWNYNFGQLNVFGYHFFNICVHIAASLLLYIFVVLLFRTPMLRQDPLQPRAHLIAFFSAFIFLTHPIQTQSVSYITQRAVSMGTMFYLATMVSYLLFRLGQRTIFRFVSYITMGLAIFCKEMTVTIPIALLIIEYVFFEFKRSQIKEKVVAVFPYFLIAAFLFVALFQDQAGSLLGLKRQMHSRGFNWNYFLTEVNVMTTYLRLFILPYEQKYEYAYPIAKSFMEPRVLFSFFVLTSMLFIAVFNLKRNRLMSFAIFWFFAALSVEAVMVSFVNRAVIYEHWMYLSTIGLSIGFTVLLLKILHNQQVFKSVMLIIAIIFCVLTYQRNFVWQTEIVFWEDGVKKTPRLPDAYLGLGVAYQKAGKYEQAYASYKKILDLHYFEDQNYHRFAINYFSKVFNNLGSVSLKMKRYQESLAYFHKALQLNKRNASAYYNLGQLYLIINQPKMAKENFLSALDLYQRYGNKVKIQNIKKILKSEDFLQ